MLDHLNIATIPVFGLSGGGPHVLALARGLANRIKVVAVVAGPCPWSEPGFLSGTWPPIRFAYLVARFAPGWMLRTLQKAMNDPRRNMKYADRMPAPDAAMLAEYPEMKSKIIDSVSAAHAQGFDGACHEWRLYTRPWGFAPEEVQVPVRLWYGALDGMAPPAMGRRLHDRLPNSQITVLPAEAHLSIITRHARRIVVDLLESHPG